MIGGWSDGALWLAAALALAIAEVIAPGFFLIFAAAGAGITGAVVLGSSGVPLLAQVALFAVASGIAIAIGGRWYRHAHDNSAPTGINTGATRLIGRTVEVSDAIVGGKGRVRVGDGAWNAHGPDTPVGTLVRITGTSGSVLLVEAATPPA